MIEKLMALVERRKAEGQEIKFTGGIGDWKKSKGHLKLDSRGKCAYCEADTAVVAHGDVEHFRPKSKYWWLALCVDNYVYSCQVCNQTYKGDEFPIMGTPLVSPKLPKTIPITPAGRKRLARKICRDPLLSDESGMLRQWLAEDPCLPHPYMEDPELMFAWSAVETAEEVHLVVLPGAGGRAKRAVGAAVEYLGLNRETLLRTRYKVYASLVLAIMAWKGSDASLRLAGERQMREMCLNDRQFSGMCRYFARRAGCVVEVS